MHTILCLGNILMKDDGIGIIIGNLLKKKNLKVDIHICETDMYYTQDIIDKSNKIILIDAVNIGLAPGSVVQIPFEKLQPRYLFQHDFAYDIKKKSGFLYGIQVQEISLGLGLSSKLRGDLKKYVYELSKLI